MWKNEESMWKKNQVNISHNERIISRQRRLCVFNQGYVDKKRNWQMAIEETAYRLAADPILFFARFAG